MTINEFAQKHNIPVSRLKSALNFGGRSRGRGRLTFDECNKLEFSEEDLINAWRTYLEKDIQKMKTKIARNEFFLRRLNKNG